MEHSSTIQTQYAFPNFLKRDQPGYHDKVLNHVRQIKEWGKSFVEGQPAYHDIDRAFDILRTDKAPKTTPGNSSISINRIKREMRDVVSSISNLRPMENAVSHNPAMQDGISKLNKCVKHWWLNTFADRKYRECAQYACGLGTGYCSPWWDDNALGYGRGQIGLKTYGPSSVLPVMITKDFDIQKAYAVTIVEETPLHLLLANFPAKQHDIQPTRNMPGWMDKAATAAQRAVNGVLGVLETPMKPSQGQMPTVDVNYTYIMDPTVNDTTERISMGMPGTSWYYEVPYIGQDIPSGFKDIRGNELYRKATKDDCRLFPLRRLIIWTDTVILQDDTSPYLHGRVPIVQLRFDDYPWDFLGYSIVHDTWKIQKARNRMLRGFCDSVDARLEPALVYDENMVSDAFMAKLQTRKPGQTLKLNLGVGEPVKPLLPYQYYQVESWMYQVYTGLGEEQDNLALVKDLTALAKAKQIPAADSIEKLLDMAGSVVQDIARGGEKFISELAMLLYPMALQFWPSGYKAKVMGDDGISNEDIDFTPGSMIPSHLPGEDKSKPSIFPIWQRVRWTIEQLSYEIEPYSQAQVSRLGRNLTLLQLYKIGFPISPWRIGKGFGLNMGDPPDRLDGKPCTNDIEEWVMWQELQADIKTELQQKLQAAQPQGRPASNQKSPEVKNKDGGTRSTVVTSR